MFEWVYRGPRDEEDFEVAITLRQPPTTGMKRAMQSISRPNILSDPQAIERLISSLAKDGKVTRIYVVNRVPKSPLAMLFVNTLCDYITQRGLFSVYSERSGAV